MPSAHGFRSVLENVSERVIQIRAGQIENKELETFPHFRAMIGKALPDEAIASGKLVLVGAGGSGGCYSGC